jgi:hypothetical protein
MVRHIGILYNTTLSWKYKSQTFCYMNLIGDNGKYHRRNAIW